MPTCYMMIGVPGSGKSTAIKELQKEMPHLQCVSSDEYLEKLAEKKGKTYNDVHSENIDSAIKWMNAQIQSFIKNKQDFVWDQTNIVKSSRLKKLKNLMSNKYDVIGIAFEIPMDELYKRLSKRVEDGGKFISPKIIENMLKDYERPTYDEGFKSIMLTQSGQFYELPKESKKLKL